ncbi:MAG TPA: HEAT repeat domain-containing protein [Candidatus Binatia bacterium]|jgi:HEAT repeat protein|nr:HEAT repeat domain-containing protein [Candidatus Binatia bacterium]
MDNTLQQLLTLVENGTVEQRCATLLVLGALKVENPRVLKTVGAILDHSNPVLKDYALRYFEEVRSQAGVPLLLKCLEEPDREMQERAVRLLSGVGRAVVHPLVQCAPTASRLWHLNAARVLCAVRGKTALKGLLQMLVSGTDDFNKSVCDLMIPAMREMGAKEQEQLYSEMETFAKSLDINRQKPAVVSAIRLLGQIGRPQARHWLFRFLGSEHPPSLRSHALVALLHCLRKEELRKDEHAKLFALLEEAEFSEVTRLTLELLDAHALAEDSRPVLSGLLGSPHEAVQKFALRKMGDFSSPATVRTLVQQLGDPDYGRRDIAARSLHKIPEARAALIKELVACDNPSKAWTIAELLPSYEGKWRQETLDALWKRLQAAVAAEDRIQAAFLHALKSASADYAYEQLAAHAARLIKAKKYKEAIPFLAQLKEFSDFRPEHKFQLALAQLKRHPHTVASRRQDVTVDLLSDLYRTSAYPLLEALKKEKNLTPEDLFYLGFTLVERPGDGRGLGKNLLEHLAAHFPRTKYGKNAKNKLKLLM